MSFLVLSVSSYKSQRSQHQKVMGDLRFEWRRSDKSMMVAIREENKLTFFLPEWVARMDPMREHGSSRSAGALPDLKDYKYRDLCALCVL